MGHSYVQDYPHIPTQSPQTGGARGDIYLVLDVSFTECNSKKKLGNRTPYCFMIIPKSVFTCSFFISACDYFSSFLIGLGLICSWKKNI